MWSWAYVTPVTSLGFCLTNSCSTWPEWMFHTYTLPSEAPDTKRLPPWPEHMLVTDAPLCAWENSMTGSPVCSSHELICPPTDAVMRMFCSGTRQRQETGVLCVV